MAIKIYVQHGELILESNIVNLKVLSDRKIYSQVHPRDPQYNFTGKKTPYGMTVEQKQMLLLKLRQKIIDKISLQQSHLVKKKESDESDDESEQKVDSPEEDTREDPVESDGDEVPDQEQSEAKT